MALFLAKIQRDLRDIYTQKYWIPAASLKFLTFSLDPYPQIHAKNFLVSASIRKIHNQVLIKRKV